MCKPVKIQFGTDFAPFLNEDDECFYYCTYTPGGFSVSPHNSMVANFKKDISHKGNTDWHYRDKAIEKFALMLHSTLKSRQYTIIPCATSKPRNSPNFNNRLDETANILKSLNYDVQFCLDTAIEVEPTHKGGARRDPIEITRNTNWTEPTKTPNQTIILVDDVFTTGAHFRAYKDIILSHYPFCNVIGIFLAKYDGSSKYGFEVTQL